MAFATEISSRKQMVGEMEGKQKTTEEVVRKRLPPFKSGRSREKGATGGKFDMLRHKETVRACESDQRNEERKKSLLCVDLTMRLYRRTQVRVQGFRTLATRIMRVIRVIFLILIFVTSADPTATAAIRCSCCRRR